MGNADLEIARRMLQHRNHVNSEIKKAGELEAQAQTIKARIGVQNARVEQGLPMPDACPDCWVQHGKKVTVVPRVSQKHDKFDRWGCPGCGWNFDVLRR
jgi:hypothetical protein